MNDLPIELKITECPRDAMQGWSTFIPTEKKIDYLNALLRVGFHTLDFGSFVSSKAIPQLRDTAQVLESLRLDGVHSRLLAIVANLRGAKEAAAYPQINYLGYPFSISEEFQRRNTNSSMEESLHLVGEIVDECAATGKEPLIYISMGFGNPYGEPWSPELVVQWVKKIASMGVKTIALADTVGVSTPANIAYLFSNLIPEVPEVEFIAHLHAQPHDWKAKIEAAYANGCKRFDSALMGIGGCPMANDALVGNVATEQLIRHFGGSNKLGLNDEALGVAMALANGIFRHD